jgi:hypothetical protein
MSIHSAALKSRRFTLERVYMRFRFSLKALLLLTLLAAAACYWWIIQPTIEAQRLTAAINRHEPRVLASVLNVVFDANPRIEPENALDLFAQLLGGVGPTAALLPQTLQDACRGQRRVAVGWTPATPDAATSTRLHSTAFVLTVGHGKIGRLK